MPRIPIVYLKAEKEYVMIELQGTFHIKSKDDKNDLELGNLRIGEDNKPFMTVANHELEGQIVDLKKPLAVLKKVMRVSNLGEEDTVMTDIEKVPDTESKKPMEYNLVNVVRKKIIFRQRPRMIVDNDTS